MLNATSDRLNYSELLSPPESYELVKAIGTSYSLDLYALLAVPIAMFFSKNMEGDLKQSRFDILEAIRKSAGKIDLFCQRGKISVPKKYNNLLALMESSVTEITPDIAESSFHPKIWLLRYEHKQKNKRSKTIYRIIVLSRNLTFDRSWDVAYFTEGTTTNTVNSKSDKLIAYLKTFYKKSNKEYNNVFFDELRTVEFDLPDGFDNFEFYPVLGLGDNYNDFSNPLSDQKFSRIIVISPFVDVSTLKMLKKNNRKITLASRKEELDKLDAEVIKLIDSVYYINETIVDGEEILDTESTFDVRKQNLHAKIFIGYKDKTTSFYIGSANCTSPAFGRNTEFMVKVDKKMNMQSIRNALFNDKNSIFEEYQPSDNIEENNQEEENISRSVLFDIFKTKFIGEYKKNEENDNYDLHVFFEPINISSTNVEVSFSLINKPSIEIPVKLGEDKQIVFENILLIKTSSYLVVTVKINNIKTIKNVIKIEVDIPENRNDVIYKSLINNRDVFLQYVKFMLQPDKFKGSLQISDYNIGESNTDTANVLGIDSNIYEYLMLSASRDPKKLTELDKIVEKLKRVDEEVVKDFLPIWDVFKEFANA